MNAPLRHEAAAELYRERTALLRSIERDIPAALADLIRVKLEYERDYLSAAAAPREASPAPDPAYFELLPLDMVL